MKFPFERAICELFTTILKFMHSGNFKSCYISSHIHFIKKMLRVKVFKYKISHRMSYLRALYDNFEFSMGKKFIGREFRMNVKKFRQ